MIHCSFSLSLNCFGTVHWQGGFSNSMCNPWTMASMEGSEVNCLHIGRNNFNLPATNGFACALLSFSTLTLVTLCKEFTIVNPSLSFLCEMNGCPSDNGEYNGCCCASFFLRRCGSSESNYLFWSHYGYLVYSVWCQLYLFMSCTCLGKSSPNMFLVWDTLWVHSCRYWEFKSGLGISLRRLFNSKLAFAAMS